MSSVFSAYLIDGACYLREAASFDLLFAEIKADRSIVITSSGVYRELVILRAGYVDEYAYAPSGTGTKYVDASSSVFEEFAARFKASPLVSSGHTLSVMVPVC